jgi:hypothetical protein
VDLRIRVERIAKIRVSVTPSLALKKNELQFLFD